MLRLNLARLSTLYPDSRIFVVDNASGGDGDRLAALVARTAPRVTLLYNVDSAVSGYEYGAYAVAMRAGAGAADAACAAPAHVVFMQQTMAIINALPPAEGADFQALFSFGLVWDSAAQREWVGATLSRVGNLTTSAPLDEACPGTFATSFILSSACAARWLAAGVFDSVLVPDKRSSQATERLVAPLAALVCNCSCAAPAVDGDYLITTRGMPGLNGDNVAGFVADPAAFAGRHVLKSYGSIGPATNADLGELWERLEELLNGTAQLL